MARNDQKTNSANARGDADESEIKEREGAIGDQEVADDEQSSADGEPIDGTQEVAASDGLGAPSWGFQEKKKRFSKEIVIAFLAIALLVSAFGFFVWNRFKTPADKLEIAAIPGAETPPDTTQTEKPPDEPIDPFVEPELKPEPEPFGLPPSSPPTRDVAATRLPAQREPDIDDVLDKNPIAGNDRTLLPPSGLLNRDPEPTEVQQREFPVEKPIGGSQPTMPETAVVETFVDNRTRTQPLDSLPTTPENTEPFERPMREPRPMTSPVFSRPVEPEPVRSEFVDPMPQPVRSKEPAPFTQAPDSLEPMPTVPEFYIVQEGDTFWDISKKLYGKHGYFLALYDHNRDAIPNADLMQPGTKLRTPDGEFLKALATKLAAMNKPVRIAMRVASDDSVMSGTTVARPRSSVAVDAGLYVTDKGLPMYRVGDKDTLMKIAVDHLGRAERWKQIYQMNRDQLKNEQDLQPGAELRLPADASRVPLAINSRSGR